MELWEYQHQSFVGARRDYHHATNSYHRRLYPPFTLDYCCGDDVYPIPTPDASPRFISIDPMGRVWFGEFFAGKIGVVDPDGQRGQVALAK